MRRYSPWWIAAVTLVTLVVLSVVVGWGLPLIGRVMTRLIPGATLVLRIDSKHPYVDGSAPADARRRTLEVLGDRLARVAPLALLRDDGDRVLVQLGRGDNPAHVAHLLTRSGRLEFKIVDDGSEYMKGIAGFFVAHRAELAENADVAHDGWTEKESGAPHSDVYLRARERGVLADIFRRAAAALPLPPDHLVAFERANDNAGVLQWRSYYLAAKSELDGDRISDVEVSWDRDSGRPEVSLTFDADGARAFEAVTARAVGKKLAILLEGTVQSAPVIEGKIAGGHARITMGGATDPFQLQQDSKDLVAILRVGSLAAPVTLLETRAPAAR